MTDTLCQPPEGLRERGGPHYVQRGKEIDHWYWEPLLNDDAEWIGGYWFFAGDILAILPEEMTAKGWTYLSPIPSHAELAALVKAARDVLTQWEHGRILTVDSPNDSHGIGTLDNLSAALSAFPEVPHD
jgi:hypothetical protein